MLGEFDIIRRFFDVDDGARSDVVLGIGDDAAIVTPPEGNLAVAIDGIIEAVHFPAGTPARAVGHRALAVNLSDLAAMGARPLWATLALSLPLADETWLADFAAGFFELARAHDVALIGGDTLRGPLQAVVQLTGAVGTEEALTRHGGRPGDAVFVSGIVGSAAAGLRLLGREGEGDPLTRSFLYPQPRVALGEALRGVASAAIDVSDGLAADLGRLTAASGCGARIDLDALPASDHLARRFSREERHYLALNGGDDYELCFTAPASRATSIDDRARAAGVVVTRIGELTDVEGLEMRDRGRVVTPPVGGYDHFQDGQ